MNPLLPVVVAATSAIVLLSSVHLAQERAHPSVSLVTRLTLPQSTADNRNIDELSGLAWHKNTRNLFAISDDNVLFEFALKGDAASPSRIDVVRQAKLPVGRLKSKNAEALDFVLRPDNQASSQLLTSYEDVNKIALIDTKALMPIDKIELPEGVAIDSRNGVEALAALPNGGVAYAYELPPKSNPRGVHSLYIQSQGGKTNKWDFQVNTDHKWNVKAIDHLGENAFVILLNVRIKDSENHRSMLLRIDGCPEVGDGNCRVTPVIVDPAALEGPAFEGMTLSASGQLFLVDDRKSNEGPATLLIMQTQNLIKAIKN